MEQSLRTYFTIHTQAPRPALPGVCRRDMAAYELTLLISLIKGSSLSPSIAIRQGHKALPNARKAVFGSDGARKGIRSHR